MSRFGAAILGCAGPRLSEAEKSLYREIRPFGFILFDRNLDAADQILALCAEMRAAAGHDAPIFIDQEGGRVQRLRPPLARNWEPPLTEAAQLGDAARAFYLRGRIIAAEMRALGIDGICIPTLDVARPETHAVLRNRCYGTDVATVVRNGKAAAAGLVDGGALPVIKHMPGHGLAQLDSHLEVPRTDALPDTLQTVDFAAFEPFADLPLGMSAHVIYEALDDRPGTVSPVIVDVIRTHIGFDGLLMTDDISMEALSGSVPERGAAALAAGCDLVLHCNGALDEMAALWARCGPMSDRAQARAEAALTTGRAPDDADIAALNAEHARLMAEAGQPV